MPVLGSMPWSIGGKLATALVAVAIAAPVTALPKDPVSCYAVTTRAVVCSLGSCEVTDYVDDYWCSRTVSGDTDPTEHNPADRIDSNLAIDDFMDVLQTVDPCAWQFDNNDRLGTTYGGPNTIRSGHTGVDIQADEGDPVGTVRHGSIEFVGWQDPNDPNVGCGYHVIVKHYNGDTSTYCHLVPDSAIFGVGSTVRAGTVIGAADSTGNSSGHHLHLTYKKGGTTRIEYWDEAGTKPSASQLNGGC